MIKEKLRIIFLHLKDISYKGFFYLLSANFLITFLSFGSQLLVVKILSPADLGRIKTMQSIISLVSIFAGLGLNTAVLKNCSDLKIGKDDIELLKNSIIITLIPSSIIILIVYILSFYNLISPDNIINKTMRLYVFLIPTSVISTLILTYYQAKKKIKKVSYIQSIIKISGMLLIVLMSYYWSLYGFIYANLIVGLLSVSILYLMIRPGFKKGIELLKYWKINFQISKWSMLNNGLGTFQNYADLYVMNYFLTDRSEIGIYSLAKIFILGLSLVTTTVQNISTPYFSEKSENKIEYKRVLFKYQKLLLLITGILAISAWFISPLFIRLIFGDEYINSIIYFRLLLFKYFLWSGYSLYGSALIGIGELKYNFIYSFIGFISSLTLSVIFIERFQVKGAAYAQIGVALIIFAIYNFTINKIIKNHFKNNKN